MNVRIAVTYAATDGSMPESVDVEWTDVDAEVVPGLVMVALDRLLTAPTARQLTQDFYTTPTKTPPDL